MDGVDSDAGDEDDFFFRFFFPSPLPICNIVFGMYLLHESVACGRKAVFLMHKLD